MLQRLHLRHFTVFEDVGFAFGPGLNVLVGTNETGKSYVLKVEYAVELACVVAARLAAVKGRCIRAFGGG